MRRSPMTDKALDPEEFVGSPPAGDANPEEFKSTDQSAAVSEDTGTVYEKTGEPETTAHDEELLGETEEET
jgi:hypothetical protein